METFKELIGMAAITIFFSLLTWALTSSYIDEYDLLDAEPKTETVASVVGSKSLLTPPAYYAKIEQPDGTPSEELYRISKKQMTELTLGDEIEGYATGSTGFSTSRDILMDSLFYLVGIGVLGFLAFCCLVATILSIPAIEQAEQKAAYKRYVKKKRKKRKKNRKQKETGWRVAGVIVLLFLFLASRFLLNLFRKMMPVGKTEAEATIFDKYSDVTYRKYEDSTYEFTVAFDDQNGDTIQVIKDVTRHTYADYDIGDRLPITYNSSNPYDLFVRGTSVQDVFQAMLTWEMLVYGSFLAVSGFVIWAYYDSRLKGKWHKRLEEDVR
ncbi:DUF3592 domain-containing protein [Sporosarcina gallistercoris]|uniref:DUF3592 domain-containing protein n=1 Tax=Sporosarcina gallistercoris TaxID=2762245 RepID=A0ABR8PIN7_9BACL|nr:DUF3592 domain-containing protein [Sporosarcina gallistercoris]MBD7908029.1 DUF3592 domain-containing protein [Sporosarcina gallistercoris]